MELINPPSTFPVRKMVWSQLNKVPRVAKCPRVRWSDLLSAHFPNECSLSKISVSAMKFGALLLVKL